MIASRRRRAATRCCSGLPCLLLAVTIAETLLNTVVATSSSDCTGFLRFLTTNSDQRFLSVNETNLAFEVGDNITLTCYSPQTPVSATWAINPAPSDEERFTTSYRGLVLSIKWTAALVTDTAVYACVYTIQDSNQNISCPHNLTVEEPISTPNISSPETVLEGDPLTLSCSVQGVPRPTIMWYRDEELLSQPSSAISTQSFSITEQLTIPLATCADTGHYSCSAVQILQSREGQMLVLNSSASTTTILSVPMVTVSAQSLTALVDSNMTLVCMITQDCLSLPVTILWSHHGVASLMNTSQHIITTTSNMSESSLTLIQVDPSVNNRDYTCTATTSAGTNNATVTLTVQASPTISTTGGLVQIDEGATKALECLYDGLPAPSDAVEWYHNGALVISITSPRVSLDIINATSYRSGIPAFIAALTITNAKRTDTGYYSCQVTNGVGPTASLQQPFSLTVLKPDYCSPSPCLNGATCRNELSSYLCDCAPNWTGLTCEKEELMRSKPVIIVPPQQQYVTFGSTVNLTCVAKGNPQPTITWFHNNETIIGAVTSFYIIDELDLASRGQYYCNASNDEGASSSDVVIVKIRGLLQFKIEVNLTREFVIQSILNGSDNSVRTKRATSDSLNFTATTEKLETLIFVLSKLDRAKIGKESATIINVQFAPNSTIESLLDVIPLLVSVIVADDQNLMVDSDELESALLNVIEGFVLSIIRFDACLHNITMIPSSSGDPNLPVILSWPETDAGQTSELVCPCGPPGFNIGVVRTAKRLCWSDFKTVAFWREPNDSSCNFTDTARRLCNLAMLERDDELAYGLDNITGMTEQIRSFEVSISTALVERLVNGSTIGNQTLSDPFLNIIDNLLDVPEEEFIDSNNEAKSSARLLQSFDNVIASYPVTDNFTVLTRQNYVASISLIDAPSDEGTVFSVNQGNASFNDDSNGSAVTVHLPSSLYDTVRSALDNEASGDSGAGLLRLTQGAFFNSALFLRANESSVEQPQVDGVIVTVDFVGAEVSGLNESVMMTFRKNTGVGNGTRHNQTQFNYSCKYWEPGDRESSGYWSPEGCTLVEDTNETATCECDHLTSFCILLDVAPVESPEGADPMAEAAITSLSIIGCCVSSVCLIVIIITYAVEKSLRKTTNGRLLLNLSSALLGLYVIFIPAMYLGPVKPLCIIAAVLLQYFFLASFIAMAGEAVVLYIELVKVFQSEIHHLVLKTAIITWVTPVFITALVFAPDPHSYAGDICRPIGPQFWVGFVVPFGVIYLFNFILFIVIISSISRQQAKMSGATGNKDLELTFRKRLVISVALSILFGLGWVLGLAGTRSFSVNYLRYSFQIVFIVLCAFQGLFIFIAYGLRLQKVRLAWLKWFYIAVGQHNKALSIATRDTIRFSTRPHLNHHNVTLGTFADSVNESVELKKLGRCSPAFGRCSPALSYRSSFESSPYTSRSSRAKRSPLPRHKHTESSKNGSLKPPEVSNNLLSVPPRGHSPSLVGSLSMSSIASSTFNTETDRDTPNSGRNSSNTGRNSPNSGRNSSNTGRNSPSSHYRDTPANNDKDTTNNHKDTVHNGIDTPTSHNGDNHKDTNNDSNTHNVCHTPV